uniref:Umc2756 n=1 Tax=Arundo donax TaxID=35708 RepID=A0A0A9E8N3_ARUDO
MNNWAVVCGHQKKDNLLLGMRERNKIVIEMDAGTVEVVVNKVAGDHGTLYFVEEHYFLGGQQKSYPAY